MTALERTKASFSRQRIAFRESMAHGRIVLKPVRLPAVLVYDTQGNYLRGSVTGKNVTSKFDAD